MLCNTGEPMRDLCEPAESDDRDSLARGVEQVLSYIYTEAERVDPDEARDYAFNVALNALASVLEVVRRDRPEQFGLYRDMVQLALRD